MREMREETKPCPRRTETWQWARMKGSRAVPKTTAMSDTTCRFEGPLDAPEFL